MRADRRQIVRFVLGLTFVLAGTQPLNAQGTVAPPSTPTEILQFSFVAPPPPVVTLTEWDGALLPDGARTYVAGPVFVDWNRKNLDWWFVWHANSSAVVSVDWQISKYPFPASGTFNPVPATTLSGQTTGNLIPVDLNPIAPRPPNWTPKVAIFGLLGTASKSVLVLPPEERPDTIRIGRTMNSLNIRFTGANIPAAANAPIQAYVVQADPVIAQSMSLYTRVIPRGADGNVIGPPSNVVVLNFGEPEPTASIMPHFIPPMIAFGGYQPARGYTFDWGCHMIYTFDFPEIDVHRGDPVDVCEDSGSFVDDIVDAFGDLFSFVADFVDWVADKYNGLKSTVASHIGDALEDLGVPCDATCVGTGLTVAMVAVGMPPELPDIEQLQQMGEGYLVDSLANYAEAQTGVPVPDAVRDKMKEELHGMIDDAATDLTQGGDGSKLYIPDVRYQFHGPILAIDIKNPSNEFFSMPMPLTVEDLTGRYEKATYYIPPISPGHSSRIALTLKPIDDPKAWMDLLPTKDDFPLSDTWAAKMLAANDALHDWRVKYLTDDLVLRTMVGPYAGFTATLQAK